MKKYLVWGILLFLIVAVSFPVWSERVPKTDPDQEQYFFYKKDGRIQVLGGKSEHAGNGLDRARTRSRSMQRQNPSDDSDDSKDDRGPGPERKRK